MGVEVYSCKCGRKGGTLKRHDDRQQGGKEGPKSNEEGRATDGARGREAPKKPNVTTPGARAPRRPEMVEELTPLLTTGSRVETQLPNHWRITPCVT